MSEEGLHVHAAHDHAVEHLASKGGLAQYVAVFTAILSTVGAMVSYQSGATQNEALLFKNQAILKKSEATDQWGYYQAKSNKQHLMELAADLTPPKKAAHYRDQIAKYEKEKAEIKAKAEALDSESHAVDEKSEKSMHPHHLLAQAMTFLQIAISLASITALTGKRWLFGCAGIAALIGIVLTSMGLIA